MTDVPSKCFCPKWTPIYYHSTMCWTYVRDCGVPLYHRREAGLGVEATPQNPQDNLKTHRKCAKMRENAVMGHLGTRIGRTTAPPGVRGTTDDSLLAATPASVRGLLFVNAHSKKCHNLGQKSNEKTKFSYFLHFQGSDSCVPRLFYLPLSGPLHGHQKPPHTHP